MFLGDTGPTRGIGLLLLISFAVPGGKEYCLERPYRNFGEDLLAQFAGYGVTVVEYFWRYSNG